MKASKVAICAVAMVLLVSYAATVSEAAGNCKVSELAPCAGALSSSAKPTAACCAKLKQQKSCLCQYAKDPTYGKYVNSPAAKKVAQTCSVSIPKC